jgi:hypothetical protein
LQEPNGGGVPQDVRGDLLVLQRGARVAGGGGVFGDSAFERVVAEPSALASGEQRVGVPAGALGEPDLDRGDGDRDQRRDPVLATFADAVDVGAGAEVDVAAVELDELVGAQPGLGGEQDDRDGRSRCSGPARRGARRARPR